ncbi:MAG: serine protease [Candidatus Paceibacterota bacterium]|jgi:hypothetical protein
MNWIKKILSGTKTEALIMDKVEISKKVKKTIRKITVIENGKVVALGTGIVIKNSGLLLTANHVLGNYGLLSNPKIFVDGIEDIPRLEYKPLLFDVSLNINMPDFAKPLNIDLAILEPEQKIDGLPFIETDDVLAQEGENVILVGFPDEVEPPLNFDKMLNFDNPKLEKRKSEIESFFSSSMRFMLIKHGMIGNVQKVTLNVQVDLPEFKKSLTTDGAVYWIDNASTFGASGGPVINSSGKLIGIICQKGMTKQDFDLWVPSGSTMALSHKLITWQI